MVPSRAPIWAKSRGLDHFVVAATRAADLAETRAAIWTDISKNL
jgi:hypothetical protein